MTRRSEKQTLSLNLRRNVGLNDAASRDTGFSCQGQVGEFIDLYLRCELFAIRLQHYYQTDKNYKKGRLNTDMLSQSFEHFEIPFDKDKLLAIFKGGEGKRRNKSAKQLRNGYLHKLSEPDRMEIINKHPVFLTEMNRLLRKRIKT